MASQKIVTVSWFDRVKQSVGGVVIGLVLIVAMVALLFWNEGRTVQTERSLAEGASLVVAAPVAPINAANEGQLIHLSGALSTSGPLEDAEFAVSTPALRLVRTVEMFQWIETSTTDTQVQLGGSERQVTTYSYTRGWSDEELNSAEFNEPDGHENPAMEIESQTFEVGSAQLGDFSLDATALDQIGGLEDFSLTSADLETVQQAVDDWMPTSIVKGAIYLGEEPSKPQLGDYRVSYQYVPVGVVSLIGQQNGDGIGYYKTQSGDELLLASTGTVAADAMFGEAASGNAIIAWVIRLVGVLLLIAGFAMVLGPISVLASVLPFLGSLLGFGTGLISGVLGIALGTLTIGSAWLFYRPLLAVLIFAVGGLIVAAIIYLGRKKTATAPVSA